MKKIAIMTDSNSGITQKEAAGLGISVLPMPFMINDATYFEDINLTQDRFYEFLENDAVVSTSQPSPDSLIHMFHKLLAEYDEVVHIPMSSGLSGSCQTACMLAQEPEFDGKVFVVNNQRISVTQTQSVLDAVELAKKGYDGAQIKKILEEDKFNSSIYIMLDTLFYLKKGGRITPAAAALGTLLKLKPVLQIQGEKLDAFSKARTMTQAKNTMTKAIKDDIADRFGEKINLDVIHSHNLEAAEEFRKEVLTTFPNIGEVNIFPLSLSVSCHIGPGSLALTCSKVHPEIW